MPVQRLLERTEEEDAIAAALDAALDGHGGLVLLEGEAGAGKSSLLTLAGELGAERGLRVCRARGGELERDLPYGIMRQLFEATVVADAEGELLTGAAALAAPVFDLTAAPAGSEGVATQHGLYWLLADLAAREPVVVIVDDAQWADVTSLRALVYIARRLDGLRAVLVTAIRTGERDAPQDLLDALAHEPQTVRLTPRPLSLTAASGLARDALGDEADDGFLTACWESSGGNPFLLSELMRTLTADEVAPTADNAGRVAELAAGQVASSLAARLRRLGDDALRVVRAVATLEPDTEPEYLAAVADLPRADVTARCEELIAASVLTDAPRPAFLHPLLKEAAYHEIAAPRRGDLHLAAARTLQAGGADSGTVAAHLLRCPPTGAAWVVDALRDAARDARARGAPETAAEFLERARAEPPPGDELPAVRRELGAALLDAADGRGLDELLAARDASDDAVVRAEIASVLVTSLVLRGRLDEGRRLSSESLTELGEQGPPGLSAHLRSEWYMGLAWTGEDLDRTALLRDVERVSVDTLGERQLLSFAAMLFTVGYGTLAEGLGAAERLAACGDLLVADAAAGWLRANTALPFVLRGDIERALALLDDQLGAARRRGSPTQVGVVLVDRAIALLARGDLAEAEAEAATAAKLFGAAGLEATMSPIASAAVAVTRLERGDVAGAATALPVTERVEDLPPLFAHGQLCVALGRLHHTEGRHDEARDALLAARERLQQLPYPEPNISGWRPRLALTEHALGRTEQARALAAEAVAVAREAGSPLGLATTLRIEGSLAGADGIDLLRDAVDTTSGTDFRLERAHCLVELGAALRRAGHRRDAREPLREGMDLAHRCGATPLEERARTELAAAGARPRSVVLTGVESLTPSELRAARLAAGGMTNREIAQELFVTTKTVETQLRAAYRKLDIAGRGELQGALGENFRVGA